MTIDELKSFIVAADTLSFSEAATRLYLTQSAVSRRVARIEQELEAPLFTRQSSALRLTAAGEAFYAGARELVQRMELLKEEVNRAQKGVAGLLRVACNYNSQTQEMLNSACTRMREGYPNVIMEVSWEVAGQAARRLLAGEVDAILCEECEFAKLEGVRSLPLLRGEWILMLRRDHPFCGRESVSLKELQDCDIVLWDRATAPRMYDALLAACRAAGVELRTRYVARSPEDTLLAVIAGKGVSFSSRGYASNMKDLAEVPLTGLPCSPDYAAGYLEANPNPALFSFVRELEALVHTPQSK